MVYIRQFLEKGAKIMYFLVLILCGAVVLLVGTIFLGMLAGWLSEKKKSREVIDISQIENKKGVLVKGLASGYSYVNADGRKYSKLYIHIVEPLVVDDVIIHQKRERVEIHYENENVGKWYQYCVIEVPCYLVYGKLIAKRVR